MTPQEKALDIFNKMNGTEITAIEWITASDYAKEDLKRKCLIVTDEILNGSKVIGTKAVARRRYWYEVRRCICDGVYVLKGAIAAQTKTTNQPQG